MSSISNKNSNSNNNNNDVLLIRACDPAAETSDSHFGSYQRPHHIGRHSHNQIPRWPIRLIKIVSTNWIAALRLLLEESVSQQVSFMDSIFFGIIQSMVFVLIEEIKFRNSFWSLIWKVFQNVQVHFLHKRTSSQVEYSLITITLCHSY